MKVVDTTVAIDHLRGNESAVDLLTRLIDGDEELLAATALVLDAALLTTNVRRFPMLSGLRPPY